MTLPYIDRNVDRGVKNFEFGLKWPEKLPLVLLETAPYTEQLRMSAVGSVPVFRDSLRFFGHGELVC
jgi:hypothetical protein